MPRAGAVLSRTAVLVLVAVAGPVSAHRLDEYLQAARIGIDPDRVQIELDLTPGVDVARAVLTEIDRNRNHAVDADEAQACAARIARDLRLELDGRPLVLHEGSRNFPAVDDVLKGEGTIQLVWTARAPGLTPGTHRLVYRNDHHADIGMYLANALVPANPRVAVTAQRRDVDQHQIAIEYELGDPAQGNAGWWLAALASGVALFAGVSRRSSPSRLR